LKYGCCPSLIIIPVRVGTAKQTSEHRISVSAHPLRVLKKKKRKRRSYFLLEIAPAPIKPSTQMSNAVPIGGMVGTGTGVGGGVGVQTTVAVSSSETHVWVSLHHAVAFTRFIPPTHSAVQRASNSIVMLSPEPSGENHHRTRLGDVGTIEFSSDIIGYPLPKAF
jgi:hypothetical protein